MNAFEQTIARVCTTPLGSLSDGTPYYAPFGHLLSEGDRVCCHLCGRWFLSVASHLQTHGWTKSDYITAFGLELGNALAGEATHKRRAAALTARQAVEPAIQRAQLSARARARSGALTAAAAQAARGRPHPPEHLPKTLATLAAIRPEAKAAANTRRGRQQLDTVAAAVATRFGFPDFASYVRSRLSAGMSMAAISRQADLHKDWVARHLRTLVPEVADDLPRHPHAGDQRWLNIAQRLGFVDVRTYLQTRHTDQHRTVNWIAHEANVSRESVLSAMQRNRVWPTPHTAKRHAAARRDHAAAAEFGFGSVSDYVMDRRARGNNWQSMATETRIPESSLRRRFP